MPSFPDWSHFNVAMQLRTTKKAVRLHVTLSGSYPILSSTITTSLLCPKMTPVPVLPYMVQQTSKEPNPPNFPEFVVQRHQ